MSVGEGARPGPPLRWFEYLGEALGLGLFMVSACAFATLLEHPASPLRHALPDARERRVLMGLAMGLTAVGLIYSPWGQRSGAHLNPAVTLAFTRLGRVAPRDAAFYLLFQFIGGALGVAAMATLLGRALAHPRVNYVVTAPGMAGTAAAFGAEALLSFLLMTIVLRASGSARLARWTGVLAGATVAFWISIEAPISGMSMNPARSFASDLVAHQWKAWWIYFIAPPLGMWIAAEIHRVSRHDLKPSVVSDPHLRCAKLHHPPQGGCLFCDYHLSAALRLAREPFGTRWH